MTVARTFAAAMGALLTVVALLGFFGNPIVGAGTGAPLLVTGIVHDLVHLTTGALLLYIAFGMGGRPQADALIGVGIAYLVLVVLTLLSPNLLSIFDYPVNGLRSYPSPGRGRRLHRRRLAGAHSGDATEGLTVPRRPP